MPLRPTAWATEQTGFLVEKSLNWLPELALVRVKVLKEDVQG